ncbi:natural cytotoxicity triggering receptor 1-like isoform X2 [Myotis myotis]|uniref:natural cytotoxicity triggering receptor 1-like isoform X2 n=1 Tax=Myotis myotis TaxID=51298 RepID=UPI00174D0846|nr:natural cytotoxicity triggering receptor 1-like isoform X2 [Myotis myotis]
MPSTLPSLLCLGLYLSLRAGAQNQTLSKPLIWAKPSFMVPNGASVFVWCQGTHRAIEYQLHFKGLFTLERPNDPGLTNKVKFSIQPMTSSTAGQYTCFYRTGELWSEPSDPLDLVITGDAGVADLASTGQPSSPDSWELHLSTTKKGLRKDLIPWDYTAENLFRVGLGLLVLVALMCLLAHTRLLRKKTKRASSQERRRRYRWQGALDE